MPSTRICAYTPLFQLMSREEHIKLREIEIEPDNLGLMVSALRKLEKDGDCGMNRDDGL